MVRHFSNAQIIQHIRSDPDLWDIHSSFLDDHLDISVDSIKFTAFAADPLPQSSPPGDPTNHWAIFLVMPTGSSGIPGSVLLDAQLADRATLQASIFLKSNKYPMSRNAESKHEVSVSGDVKVSTILDVVIANRRDHYRYHAECEGCSCWVLVVAQDLAQANIIRELDVTQAKEVMSQCWPDAVDRPIKPGTFEPFA